MPILVKKWRCKLCKTEYGNEKDAERCEAAGLPDRKCPAIPGDEVRLKNRSGRTYTLAKVKHISITLFHCIGVHEWLLELQEPVFLDHKWEDESNMVEGFYVVSEERIKETGMTRRDNDHGGDK